MTTCIGTQRETRPHVQLALCQTLGLFCSNETPLVYSMHWTHNSSFWRKHDMWPQFEEMKGLCQHTHSSRVKGKHNV